MTPWVQKGRPVPDWFTDLLVSFGRRKFLSMFQMGWGHFPGPDFASLCPCRVNALLTPTWLRHAKKVLDSF